MARLLNGLTQQELGDMISASRQYIHQLESDVRSPAQDVLNVLYEVLFVKADFFTIPIANEVKLEQCHFRKRKTTPIGVANRVLAFSTIFEQLITFVNEYLELPAISFPDISPVSQHYTSAEIENAARKCRALWGLADAPIANMMRALENAGVVITQFQGVSDKVDALSLNRRFPIIVRNDAKKSVCRMRFDLAHELGHFVLHEGIETGDNLTESEANKFASEFLFPRTSFLQEHPNFCGRKLDWNLIYGLKVRWGMSARAIIYKAHQHKLITAQQFRSANVRLNKTGQARVEHYDEVILQEKPELLIGIFDTLRTELGISFSHAANALAIEPSMLSIITSITPECEKNSPNVVSIYQYK